MIGRKEEVEALREAAMADRSRFVVVYGRRRVGKTFLIREAFDYRFTFSHTGMETSSMADQLESFHASLIDQGMGPCEVPKNWIQAFSLLKRFLKASSDGRKVVFIDELPWMEYCLGISSGTRTRVVRTKSNTLGTSLTSAICFGVIPRGALWLINDCRKG